MTRNSWTAPWHGLGKSVEAAHSAAEMLDIAGLANWDLRKEAVYFRSESASAFRKVRDQFAVVRTDSERALGIVGDAYTIVQNEQSFAWADDLMGGGAKFIRAGSLSGGARVWAVAQLPYSIHIETPAVGDDLDMHLYVEDSHDGGSTLTARLMVVRLACLNGMTQLVPQATVKLRHTRSVHDRMRQSERVLAVAQQVRDAIDERASKLVAQKLDEARAQAILDALVPMPEDGESRAATIARTRRADIDALRHHDTVRGLEGTAWGFLNAVTAYTNHVANRRSTTAATAEENRMLGIIGGDDLERRALALLEAAR